MALITPLTGVVLITLLAYYLFRWYTRYSSLPLPPGPQGLPIIGNLHQAPKSHARLQYHEWSKTYGPVVYLNMFGQNIILLSSYDAAHDLMSKRGATFSDRPRSLVAGELALKGFNILLRPYDERFKLHQKLESPLLSTRSASTYFPFQDLESKHLLFDLLTYAGTGTDIHPIIERTTASIIYGLCYGFRLMTNSEPVLRKAHEVTEDFNHLAQFGRFIVDIFPILNHLPAPLAPWKAEAERHWQKQRALHVENLETGLASDGWNFSKFLDSSVKSEGVDMSVEELALDVGVIAAAALDTSTQTLNWFVVAAITAEKGTWVSKARDALDSVVGRDRLPTFDDKPNLVYIDAIVEEVLRWRPAAVAGVPHYTKVTGTYKGYTIPANSAVIGNSWAIAHDPEKFGPNAADFDPDRWIAYEADGKTPVLKNLPPIGFGYGRRACPGRHIARNVLWIAIARMLWAFDIQAGLSESGEQTSVDPLAAEDGLIMQPVHFRAAFKPRGSWATEIITRECDTNGFQVGDMLEQVGRSFQKVK